MEDELPHQDQRLRRLIGIITRHTPKADGQLWEIQCAYEESVPVLLIYGTEDRPTLTVPLVGRRVLTWTWADINTFVSGL